MRSIRVCVFMLNWIISNVGYVCVCEWVACTGIMLKYLNCWWAEGYLQKLVLSPIPWVMESIACYLFNLDGKRGKLRGNKGEIKVEKEERGEEEKWIGARRRLLWGEDWSKENVGEEGSNFSLGGRNHDPKNPAETSQQILLVTMHISWCVNQELVFLPILLQIR